MLAGGLHDIYHVYTYSFYISIVLLIVTAAGTLLLRPSRVKSV